MDRAGPLFEGGEYSWGEAGEPAEILLKAYTRAEEEGLPVAVKLEDGAEWNPEWARWSHEQSAVSDG